MSVSNLLEPNNYELFCDTLTCNSLIANSTTIPNLNTTTVTAVTGNITTINSTTINNSGNVNTSVLNSTSTNAANIHINGGSALTNYIELNITNTVSGPWAVSIPCTLKFSKINNRVTVCQTSNVTASQSVATFITFNGTIPAAYLPANIALVRIPIWVLDNTYQIGSFYLDPSSGQIRFYVNIGTNFSGAGPGALVPFSVTYDVSN